MQSARFCCGRAALFSTAVPCWDRISPPLTPSADRFHNDPGYADMLRVTRECSAVTAACLLTRRRDYLDVGGMDEVHFPVNFNDVDYCLKLRAMGKRIVFTPHARLLHLESASRGAGHFARSRGAIRARTAEFEGTLGPIPHGRSLLQSDLIPRCDALFGFGLAAA